MKYKGIIVVFFLSQIFCVNCGKKFDRENGVLIETIQATSYKEGYRPENVFISGKSWKPYVSRTPKEGITFFFANESKMDLPGVTAGYTKIDSIVFVCPASSVQEYATYINASFYGRAKCGEKFQIGSLVHSLYVEPVFSKGVQSIELDEIEFYKNDKKAPVLFPIGIDGKVIASSVTEPKEGYPAYNLFDGAKEFGWVEGKSDDGIGEYIQIDLEKEITLSGLEVYNGYQRSDEHFKKNGRVEKLSISNGAESTSVILLDRAGSQRILLSKPLTGKQFKFTIEAAWSGEKWKDTALSEMILLGPNLERYTVNDSQYLARERSIIEKAKGTPIGDILGDKLENTECMINDSITLRPNGSFVYWRSSSGNEGVDVVMDGNWILEKNSKEESQIYIFGRLYSVYKTIKNSGTGPYDSTDISEESKTEIFSDRLKLIKVGSHPEISCDGDAISSDASILDIKGTKIYGSYY
ncbi:discoidin domain-containing protein [Leptospira johnsonii]|uniref:F5/8 type C domain protein n=1 Tax=Leptospira johnsonii TaxID=1917820 RepID=A0A2P2D391_9LEPT|nr:discoidin domain-containing protein [Leptospira johnsonii]GBF39117.1 F5/8 type C domain protein [Leptospira johnsonii]